MQLHFGHKSVKVCSLHIQPVVRCWNRKVKVECLEDVLLQIN